MDLLDVTKHVKLSLKILIKNILHFLKSFPDRNQWANGWITDKTEILIT